MRAIAEGSDAIDVAWVKKSPVDKSTQASPTELEIMTDELVPSWRTFEDVALGCISALPGSANMNSEQEVVLIRVHELLIYESSRRYDARDLAIKKAALLTSLFQ
jgi:hypothetical protein